MNTKRTIELTHDEIELIQNALLQVYKNAMKLADQSSGVMGREWVDNTMEMADKYIHVSHSIQSGSKDV